MELDSIEVRLGLRGERKPHLSLLSVIQPLKPANLNLLRQLDGVLAGFHPPAFTARKGRLRCIYCGENFSAAALLHFPDNSSLR